MPMLPLLALVVSLQDRTETKGQSYAQILAMGRSKWHDFYVGKDEGITAAESSAEGIYGDALGWRNDRLDKPRAARLRKAITSVGNDAIGVGSAMTGGGTMWNIIGASLYADAEQAVYLVLSRSGTAPGHRVSDVDRAYRSLRAKYAKATPEGDDAKRGRTALASLRKDLDLLVAQAARLPRKGSDALLEFAVHAMGAADAAG